MPKKPSNVRQADSVTEGFFRALGEVGDEVFGDCLRIAGDVPRREQLEDLVRSALIKVDRVLTRHDAFEGVVQGLTTLLDARTPRAAFEVVRNRGMGNRSKAASVAVAETLRQRVLKDVEKILVPLQKAG